MLAGDPDAERLAVLGPFPTAIEVALWALEALDSPGYGVDCHLLILTPGPQPHPGDLPAAHTIRVTCPAGDFCYGPFPDALHATAWAHQIAASLDLREHTLTRHPISPPFDLTGQAPAPCHARVEPGTADHPRTWPQHAHLVLLSDSKHAATVGIFGDQTAATAWAESQRPAFSDATLTPLPLLRPLDAPQTHR